MMCFRELWSLLLGTDCGTYPVKKGLFSLALVNKRIKVFSYGADIANKPSEIATLCLDTAIKQSGISYAY